MGVDVEVAAGADGDPDLDDTDPVVRRWRVEQVVAQFADARGTFRGFGVG